MTIKLRKQLFLAVRNLPYKIGTKSSDTSCVAKTKLLGELLERIGLKTQVWRAVVKWTDLGLPDELLQLAASPTVNHIFLKVFVPETKEWVIVDPTWDKRFENIFPINNWDGKSSTTLACPSNQIELVGSISQFNFRDFDPEDAFTQMLNDWYINLIKCKGKNDREI